MEKYLLFIPPAVVGAFLLREFAVFIFQLWDGDLDDRG